MGCGATLGSVEWQSRTALRSAAGVTDGFEVGAGLHRGPALSTFVCSGDGQVYK